MKRKRGVPPVMLGHTGRLGGGEQRHWDAEHARRSAQSYEATPDQTIREEREDGDPEELDFGRDR